MEALCLSFWNRSVSAGWLILAVAALRLVLKKAPKSIRCLLWLLVGIRLLCPFSIQSAASLIPRAETLPPVILAPTPPQMASVPTAASSPANGYRPPPVYEEMPVPYTWGSVCAVIWLTGAVLLAAWALASWLRLRRRVAEAVSDGDGVWLCGSIDSPFLLGIFRPRIYLPFGLDGEVRTYVVAHEKAHIKRCDHIAKPVGFLLLAAYWFQPLVWLAYVLLCRDIELACDELVIRELGAACKKPYAEALLLCGSKRGGDAVCPLAFGEVGVKERVKNVLNYRKPAFWVVAVSLAACVAAAVCFLTDPTAPDSTPEAEPAKLARNEPAADADMLGGHRHWLHSTSAYTGAALLYEPLEYSSHVSACHLVFSIYYDTLTTQDAEGNPILYKLEEAAYCTTEEFYALFYGLAQQETALGTTLLPQNARIARYLYKAEEAEDDGDFPVISIWEISPPVKLWLGVGGRLFSVVDCGPKQDDNSVLWDYDPSCSTVIPIRFELDGPVSLSVSSGALLSKDGDRLQYLPKTEQEIGPGETVYWQPSLDGAPDENAKLTYRYQWDSTAVLRDHLELSPMLDSQGLYGAKTYRISNNWSSLGSKNVRWTAVETDGETGELLVRRYGAAPNNGPYPIRSFLNNMPVRGMSLSPEADSTDAVQ